MTVVARSRRRHGGVAYSQRADVASRPPAAGAPTLRAPALRLFPRVTSSLACPTQGGHMPANASLRESSTTAAAANATPDIQIPEDRRSAGNGGTTAGSTSTAERLTAERTERRRQRALAHEASRSSDRSRGGRRRRVVKSAGAVKEHAGLLPRAPTLLTLLAVLVTGAALGAILGSVSASGWVIGLLVAGLTVLVSTVVRSFPRSSS